jgi:hypothetical protein
MPSTMRWLIAASASCVCFSAAAFGTFVPLREPDGIQYLFALPSLVQLLTISLAVVAALTVLYFSVVSAARRRAPQALAVARSGAWLAPLCLLALVVVGIAPAVPGSGQRAAPLSYFFYDLRWWWVSGAAIWAISRADRVLGGPIAPRLQSIAAWPAPARLLLFDGILFTAVIAWAVASTPNLRFTGVLHGDETKYIRYCEVWYQGGGFEISSKKPFTDLPLDAGPAMHRIPALIAASVAEESRALVSDLRQFAGNPTGFRWNRARGEDGFVEGKRGGVYQIYQPGLSLLLFPGYFLDRYLLGLQPGYQNEFPAELVMTNLMLLVLYGASAVALFRLFRHALGSDLLAAAWAAVATITLPTTAFAFQFYPELPALLAIVFVTTYGLFTARESGSLAAAGAGIATGYLTWLHPRFLLVSLVLAVWSAIRTERRNRWTFIASCSVVYLSVMAFDYRVTGSWLPTALWDASRPGDRVNAAGLPLNLLGYAFHRTWGLLAHAPILFGVLPGLALLARRNPRDAAWLTAIALALALPSAAHTLSAAGGTPGRLVMAIVPPLVWPVAILVRRFWHSAAVRAGTAIAVVVSLDAGLAYNVGHVKAVGPMHAAGVSGWRPNLAFPLVRDGGWDSLPNLAIVLALGALLVGGAVAAYVRARREPPTDRAVGNSRWLAPAATALGVVALSSAATAANGDWFHDAYLVPRGAARETAARRLLASERCRACFTSSERTIDWTELEPNPARGVQSHVELAGSMMTLSIAVEGDGMWTGFGRMRVDFGDQSSTRWTGVVGHWRLSHVYREPGEYLITISLQLRDGTVRLERRTVKVAG